MEMFGILSAILYNIAGVEAARKAWKQGHSQNIMVDRYLYPWLGGSVTGFIYALSIGDVPFIIGTFLGVVCGGIILYFKLRPRNR